MCLLSIAYRQHDSYPLVVIGNRDEFFARPSATAYWWEDDGGLLAGRDLQSQGSWLGVHLGGRFAAVTNYRELTTVGRDKAPKGEFSRGVLVREFLSSRNSLKAEQYLQGLKCRADDYAGFNLIVADATGLFYLSNRENVIRSLSPGIYGLSNNLLDVPWPKVIKAKQVMRRALSDFDLSNGPDHNFVVTEMQDKSSCPTETLPSTGIPVEIEQALAKVFVHLPHQDYGTRTISSLWIHGSGTVNFCEQNFQLERGAEGQAIMPSELSCFKAESLWTFTDAQ